MSDQSPPSPEVRADARAELTAWLAELETDPDRSGMVAAVVADEESDIDRWFVRLHGDAKDVYSVWFELDQRTLAYETYVMPAPEENHAAFFEQLLIRNAKLFDLSFSIGAERAIFLKGRLELDRVSSDSLDRILGTVHATVEQCFVPAIRLGFASRFGN